MTLYFKWIFHLTTPMDNSTASALVRATLDAKKAHINLSANVEWAATLYADIIPSSQKEQCSRGGNSVSLPKRKHNRPVKASPLPNAINLDGPLLLDRISSLQKRALVGRWHFPSMEETQFRNWIMARWTPLLVYSPSIVRLMNDWFSFHFLREQDLEIIFSKPWVRDRNFLALYKWY